MRLTNYGMLTNREEPNENELALEYIRKNQKRVRRNRTYELGDCFKQQILL